MNLKASKFQTFFLAAHYLLQQKVMQEPWKEAVGEGRPGGGRGAVPGLLLVLPTSAPLQGLYRVEASG